MFGIGGFELIIILLFIFLVFGPERLPQIAQTVAKFAERFRKTRNEVDKVMHTDVYNPRSDDPFQNSVQGLEKIGKITGEAVKGAVDDIDELRRAREAAAQAQEAAEKASAAAEAAAKALAAAEAQAAQAEEKAEEAVEAVEEAEAEIEAAADEAAETILDEPAPVEEAGE